MINLEICVCGRGIFLVALTIFAKTWLILGLYDGYMTAVNVYCTATRLGVFDLYFRSKYTLYSW